MANIVYYELEDSPFSLKFNNLEFIFSSEFYKIKFQNCYKDYIKNETLKLNIRYRTNILADEMLLLNLYKLIEKRGFKVIYKGIELNKEYNIECSLNNTSMKEC